MSSLAYLEREQRARARLVDHDRLEPRAVRVVGRRVVRRRAPLAREVVAVHRARRVAHRQVLATADVAHAHGALAAVDNTFATPLNQQPLKLGCDVVMHSTTKYIGGHSDVIGGLAVVNDPELAERLAGVSAVTGGIAGPFDAYLTFRGIKTLALRMERHQSNALAIATWLKSRAGVQRVIYPGLPEHPAHELAKTQMQQGFGAVVAVEIEGAQDDVAAFMNRLQIFAIAEGLGGVESLVGHPRTMSHSRVPEERKAELGLTENLVRLSVGIEHVDDLIADLDQALN